MAAAFSAMRRMPLPLIGGRRVAWAEVLLTGLSGFATFLIVATVAVIVFEIVAGGAGVISWDFLTKPPADGLRAGGSARPSSARWRWCS
jgi:hypothetical protein